MWIRLPVRIHLMERQRQWIVFWNELIGNCHDERTSNGDIEHSVTVLLDGEFGLWFNFGKRLVQHGSDSLVQRLSYDSLVWKRVPGCLHRVERVLFGLKRIRQRYDEQCDNRDRKLAV